MYSCSATLCLAGVRAWRRNSYARFSPARPSRRSRDRTRTGAGTGGRGRYSSVSCPGMSAGPGAEAAAREIERKLGGLKALYVHFEQEEGLADSAAFRTEKKLKWLGRQKKNEDQDFAEARKWLDSLAQGGTAGLCGNKSRVERARGMLRMIHLKTVRICEEASVLHERREHY